MSSAWSILLLLCLFLVGCGGDNKPVNDGKDKPVPVPVPVPAAK